MAVEILFLNVDIAAEQPELKDPGFIDYIRKDGAISLAELCLLKAAHMERIEGLKDGNQKPIVRFRFSIGLERDVDELIMRGKQKALDRKGGRGQAAALLEEEAKRYDAVAGSTAASIALALRERARAILAIKEIET